MHFLEPSQSGIVTTFVPKTASKVVPFRNLFWMWRPCDFAAIYYTLERFWVSSRPGFSTFFLNVFQRWSETWKSRFCIDSEVPFWNTFWHFVRCKKWSPFLLTKIIVSKPVLIRNGKRDYVLESNVDFVQASWDLKISHKQSSSSRCNEACKRHWD